MDNLYHFEVSKYMLESFSYDLVVAVLSVNVMCAVHSGERGGAMPTKWVSRPHSLVV